MSKKSKSVAPSVESTRILSEQSDEMFPSIPECQCSSADQLCPIHYTLPIPHGRPAMSLVTGSRTPTVTSSSGATSPTAQTPSDQAHSYRFTPPMSLEDFPRPASINRGESLATVLEERYQRRKAQNRTAQRAYRDREKQRLSVALQRVREMESDLQSSIDMQKHWQALYENLFGEYERLWNEINMMTVASPLSLSRTNSLTETSWMEEMGGGTAQGGGTSGSNAC